MNEEVGAHSQSSPPAGKRGDEFDVIGTRLLATDYDALTDDLLACCRARKPRTLSFCNTFMVTMRRIDPNYRAITQFCDTNLPDGMPLVWCMNLRGARMRDRVYGPIFMRRFLERSPSDLRHYFLGGDETCLKLLGPRVGS